MATDKLLSTHSSILLAGGLIAAALYLGLRAQGSPSPPASGAPPSAAAEPPSALDTAAPPRPSLPRARAQPTTGAIDRSAAAAAREDLERHRAEVVRRCLASAPGDRPAPPGVKLTLNMTFDAEGRQISRGVSEDRATYREGVSACAMATLPALRIPPQGAPVYVEVPWTLL